MIKSFSKKEKDKLKQIMKNAIPDIRKKHLAAIEAGDVTNINVKRLMDDFPDDADIVKRINNIFDNPLNKNENFDWLRVLLDPKSDITALANKGPLGRMAQSLRNSKADDFVPKSRLSTWLGRRKNADDLIENADVSPFAKRVMNTGAIVGTSLGGLAIFMGMGGNESLQKWIDNTTGLNCGQKAEDQELDPASAEYAAAVEKCQDGVTGNLMKLGFGVIAIVGLVGLVAVTRAIPKRDSEEDSEEEAEE